MKINESDVTGWAREGGGGIEAAYKKEENLGKQDEIFLENVCACVHMCVYTSGLTSGAVSEWESN